MNLKMSSGNGGHFVFVSMCWLYQWWLIIYMMHAWNWFRVTFFSDLSTCFGVVVYDLFESKNDVNFLFQVMNQLYIFICITKKCHWDNIAEPNLGLRPANKRRRYKVTTSLIGWEQTWNQPWYRQQNYFIVHRQTLINFGLTYRVLYVLSCIHACLGWVLFWKHRDVSVWGTTPFGCRD